jgi:membrane protein
MTEAGMAGTAPQRPTDMPRSGWLAVLKRSVREFKHDDVGDRAAALTYYGVLSLFPGLLVLVSILGLVGRSTTQKVLNNVDQLAPGGVSSFLHSVVSQVQGRAGAAGVAGIIGLVVALWSASGYVAAFMRGANAIYDVDEGRPIWKTATVRLLTTVAVVIMLVIAAAIVILTGPIADQVGSAFGIGHAAVLAWDIAKWPVLLVLVSLMFALLYHVSPNVEQPRFRWITPGGVLAVVVWLVVSGLFAVYVGFSGSYNKTYGALATVIIFLVWLWLTNVAILLGAEFNAELQRERAIEGGMPAEVEPFAELRDTRKLDEEEKRRVARAGRIRRGHLRHSSG